jgi:hypothetical protein
MTAIADLRERLARIETKLDALIALEKRLRRVENRQHYWAGAGTIIGAAITLLVKANLGH